MKRIIMATLAALLAAPLAQAQAPPGVNHLDCTGGCTVTPYGFGNEDAPEGGSTLVRSELTQTFGIGGSVGRIDNQVCGQQEYFSFNGRVNIVEMDGCQVSSTNRCMVEIPDIGASSGNFNVNEGQFNLGPGGLVQLTGALFVTYQGNVGVRQLNGRCVDGNGDNVTIPCNDDSDCNLLLREVCGPNNLCQDNLELFTSRTNTRVFCSLDSECGAGESCLATCAISGANCASDADCPGAGDSCGTEIDWDPIGTCEDDSSILCTRANCPNGGFGPACECGAGQCLDGFEIVNDLAGCVCCDHTGNTFCAAVGFAEYPALLCPFPSPNPIRRDASDWEFEGGAGTNFTHQNMVVPGQQEGHCAGNDQRSCGTRSSLYAGADNGKCTSGIGLFCSQSAVLCTEDADCPGGALDTCESPCVDAENPANLALASECDDVANGGIAGDFCNYVEAGHRNFSGSQTLLDGRPDPASCISSFTSLVAEAEINCSIPVDIPDGDPQPGCLLVNFGIDRRPDQDCNEVDDADEGRCAPDGVATCNVDADCASGNCVNGGDLCPFIGEGKLWTDTNNDGIGDQCQCGDCTGDGAITGIDIGCTALCANGVSFCDFTQVDATGDNATTAEDIGGIVSVVNGVVQPESLLCLRNFTP